MSLSTRITLSITLVTAALLTLLGVLSVDVERLALQSILHKQGNAIAQSIAAYSVEAFVAEDYPALEMTLNTIGNQNLEIVLIEVSRGGKMVAHYGNVSSDNVLTSTADVVLYNSSSGNQKLGEIKLLLSERGNEAVIAAHIKNVLIYMVLFLILFSLLLRYQLSRLVVKRIENLRLIAEQVISTELPERIEKHLQYTGSADEIDVLHERFASMLAGLQSRDQARCATLDDVMAGRASLLNLTNAMTSALIVVSQAGIISLCNVAVVSKRGRSVESMVGKPLRDALPYSDESIQIILDAIRKQTLIKRLPVLKRSTNQSRFFELSIYPIHASTTGAVLLHIEDEVEWGDMQPPKNQSRV
ncbi:MAG: PAS domain-containing protein [Gallionella sp.]